MFSYRLGTVNDLHYIGLLDFITLHCQNIKNTDRQAGSEIGVIIQ